jgi:hypothetical protein
MIIDYCFLTSLDVSIIFGLELIICLDITVDANTTFSLLGYTVQLLIVLTEPNRGREEKKLRTL